MREERAVVVEEEKDMMMTIYILMSYIRYALDL